MGPAPPFFYAEWRNFSKVINKAITACEKAGREAADHFVEVNKMVDLVSGAIREITDIGLSRYAFYLIAANVGIQTVKFISAYVFAIQVVLPSIW